MPELEACPNLRKLMVRHTLLSSLAGIRYCSKLEHLDCDYSSLENLEGIETLHSLLVLHCQTNYLSSIAPVSTCVSLQELDCSANRITALNGIGSCISLQKLNCSRNKITVLNGISSCISLLKLRCNRNSLQTLQCERTCPSLETIRCKRNRLVVLTDLESYPRLRKLDCSYNELTTLGGIGTCTELTKLDCEWNGLISLTGIEQCRLLRKLECGYNRIESLEPLVNLVNLQQLETDENELEVPSARVVRMLERLAGVYRGNERTIYNNSQNVHDTTVQLSICTSVRNLLTDLESAFSLELIRESDLDAKTKRLLLEFCADKTTHSTLLITYQQLLAHVWLRINTSKHRSELLAILAELVLEAEDKCWTGRFNRLVSVLVGFYDDIEIAISDRSRIGAIVLAIKGRMRIYDPQEHRLIAEKELTEAGYAGEEIEPWLEAIHEETD